MSGMPRFSSAFFSLWISGVSLLHAQASVRPNRVIWLGMFPEPLPSGDPEFTLEASSQFLRPDNWESKDKRSQARMDGEDWQAQVDLPFRMGPFIANLRMRGIHSSGGIGDSSLNRFHRALDTPDGGRSFVPTNQLEYGLIRDGQQVARLTRPATRLMDVDLALLYPMGSRTGGARLGVSAQAPTGREDDFSGNKAWDYSLGGAAWKHWTYTSIYFQAEHLFLNFQRNSLYPSLLARTHATRAWAGIGIHGNGNGFWSGFGLDLSVGYMEKLYQTGIPRVDAKGLQQHWTFTHAALPDWRFGFSEEAGSYFAPDVTFFVSRSF